MTGRKITLSPEQARKFETAVKIGIVKELHREKMLTDTQLGLVLSDIQRQDACAPTENAYSLGKSIA